VTDQRIPVIDLAVAGGHELATALERASCAFVVGPGVPTRRREEMVDVSRAFFHLPRAQKARVEWPGTRPWTGWQPVHEWSAQVSGYAVPDLVERFEVRLPMPDGPLEAVDQEGWARAFPLWPQRPAAMAATWTAFYADAAALSSRLMGLLADAYDLPADELPAWTRRQFSNLVVNWYPAQSVPPPEGSLRQHAHTDIGGLTLLWADDAPGGLEVRFPGERDWAPVAVPPDAFLIQAGDLLARWTNHRIRANVHRVVNPPATVGAAGGTGGAGGGATGAVDGERMSVVFFHHPDLSADVRPAPSCMRPGQRDVRPVNARAHVVSRQYGRPGGAEQPVAAR
jgi:isopenicillin N synthase-like dioxygenase